MANVNNKAHVSVILLKEVLLKLRSSLVVVQGYNPALMRQSQDDCELSNSLGRKRRWVLKVKLDLCNPNLPVTRPQGTARDRQVLCPVRMVGKLT